jgi:hypothetical protein
MPADTQVRAGSSPLAQSGIFCSHRWFIAIIGITHPSRCMSTTQLDPTDPSDQTDDPTDPSDQTDQ